MNIYGETLFLKSGKPERPERNHLCYLNPSLELKKRDLPVAKEGLNFPKDNDFYQKQTLWKMMGNVGTFK